MHAQLIPRVARDTRHQGRAAGIETNQDMGSVVRCQFTDHGDRQTIEDAAELGVLQGETDVARVYLAA